MPTDRYAGMASLCVLLAGGLWGLYWVPVRVLADAGLGGALGSLVVAAVSLLLLLPVLVVCVRGRQRGAVDRPAVLATAAGGASFMLYSVGLVEGRVSSVILLFYLTPVWTTLITACVLRWPIPRSRYLVLALGLVGLALVLGGHGGWPVPHAAGEWLGLAAGALWSAASVGMRVRGELRPLAGTTVFAAGAFMAGLVLWWLLPDNGAAAAVRVDGQTVAWVVAAALVWWIASMMALVWAAARLDPARVGILLMSEVLVGVLSSAVFAGEVMAPLQIAGAAVLVSVGVLDVFGG